jgi:biopolymer transport protein TolR
MSMMGSKSGKRLMSDINVTPLVDVMLVLLIIFMITAPMMTQGINLDLQESTDKPREQKKDRPLVISIGKDGQIKLRDNAGKDSAGMSRDQLIQELTRISAGMLEEDKKKQKVFIIAGPDVSYGQVVPLFADARNAGFSSLSPAQPGR